MLRLIGFLVTFLVGAGGYVAIDYRMSSQWASKEDAEGLTFSEYLGGLTGRIASFAASSGSENLPTELADMMPRAPEGWTVRPTTKDDITVYLPKEGAKADDKSIDLVKSVASTKVSSAEVVNLTYEKGERRVVVQAIRYPDVIFTSFVAIQQRFELRMMAAEMAGRPFMTVRGLDVTEDFLGDGMRGRYFFAEVGAQIHVRVLASKKMKDADMVPFFQTLHVKAMNGSVIDRQEGLGDVPVIVLASAMNEAEREAYEADRTAREAEAALKAQEERKAGEAEAEAAAAAEAEEQDTLSGEGRLETSSEKPSAGFSSACEKGSNGIKRCSIGSGG